MDDREAQEPRPERAVAMVTPEEKAAIRFVAAYRKVTESDLLRVTLISDIVAEYDRLNAKLAEVA